MEALAFAGGLNIIADPHYVKIFRQDEGGKVASVIVELKGSTLSNAYSVLVNSLKQQNSSLWGEGCPRTVLEALWAGCVVIAFDIIGNRETLIDRFNGIIVPRYRPDLMAEALINLFKTTGRIEQLRKNSLSIISPCHTFEARWPAVMEFLDLS
jgi:glycosyltransferase involved in cell wall biosynthesis